jgi:hypothetical protein
MDTSKIDLQYIVMYRAVHLMMVSEEIFDAPVSEREEIALWLLAERTVNKHLLDEDFLCFPCLRTSCPAPSKLH